MKIHETEFQYSILFFFLETVDNNYRKNYEGHIKIVAKLFQCWNVWMVIMNVPVHFYQHSLSSSGIKDSLNFWTKQTSLISTSINTNCI